VLDQHRQPYQRLRE